jgi:hypothetical protein
MIFEESIYSRPFLQHLLLPSRFQSTRLPPFGRNGTGFELLQAIIIASDNDEKPKEAFQRVRSALTKAQPWVGPPAGAFPVPEETRHIKEGPPSIAIMTLPRRRNRGSLDSICVQVARESATGKILRCIQAYSRCAQFATLSASKQAKAELRAFITCLYRETVRFPALPAFFDVRRGLARCQCTGRSASAH